MPVGDWPVQTARPPPGESKRSSSGFGRRESRIPILLLPEGRAAAGTSPRTRAGFPVADRSARQCATAAAGEWRQRPPTQRELRAAPALAPPLTTALPVRVGPWRAGTDRCRRAPRLARG
eukprot:scaffold1685_cov390-Prasinococcus_capsulatus_cf.AAC.6